MFRWTLISMRCMAVLKHCNTLKVVWRSFVQAECISGQPAITVRPTLQYGSGNCGQLQQSNRRTIAIEEQDSNCLVAWRKKTSWKGHETFNKTFLNGVDLIFGSTNLSIWSCYPLNQPNELLSNCDSLFTFDSTLFTDLAPRKIQSISRNVCYDPCPFLETLLPGGPETFG